jgi:diacylglycerol kinase family enzyme
MNVFLILNDGARSLNSNGRALAPSDVLDAFRTTGLCVQSRVAPGNQLDESLRAAISAAPSMIVVGGGDGTISTAAQRLAGTEIPLGVLPLGTLNHFARDLGMPPGWRDAVAAVAAGEVRTVDVAEVNGRVFINNCSIGSYADAVRKRDALRRRHGLGKWWAMTIATFRVFRRLRRLRLRVEANGQTVSLRSPFIVVANNRYSGHVLDYSLRARLDEGRLWIYTTRARRHAAVLRFMWQSLLHEIDAVEGLDKFEVTEATIDYDYTGLPVALDGELADLRPPLRFRTRRGALRVIVPHPRHAGA